MKTMAEPCKKGKRRSDVDMVPPFVKIMFGPNWSKVMIIPPLAERTMSGLVNQTIQLEDSAGQCWEVTLSEVKEYLGFRSGWDKFSSENRLSEEDILAFDYIGESLFKFKIYRNCVLQNPKVSKEKHAVKNSRIIGNSSQANGGRSRKKSKTGGHRNGSSAKHAAKIDYEPSVSQPIIAENNSNLKKVVSVAEVETDNNIVDEGKAKNSASKDKIIHVLDDTDIIETEPAIEVVPTMMEPQSENIRKEKDPLPSSNPVVSDATNVKDEILKKNLAVITKETRKSPEAKGNAYSGRTLIREKTKIVDTFDNPKPKPYGIFASKTGECGQRPKDSPIKGNDDTILKKVKPEMTLNTKIVNTFGKTKFELSGKIASEIAECGQSSKALTIQDNGNTILKQVNLEPFSTKTKVANTIETPQFKLIDAGESASKIGESGQNSKALTLRENGGTILKQANPEPFTTKTKIANIIETPNYELIDVKPEPDTSFDYLPPPPNVVAVSCVVDKIDQDFFEFTKTSPIKRRRGRGVAYQKHMVVYVRDPHKRLNAFLYVEEKGLKFLKGPWKAFFNANSIKIGDEISFRLETDQENIYSLGIVRK